MNAMGVASDSINIFDLDGGYMACLYNHLKESGMETIKLNLGKTLGDLLSKGLLELETPCDILVSGPPCPPWAGQGNHNGMKDFRAKVFIRVLLWVFFFVKCGGLLACILENVEGILAQRHGRDSAVNHFLSVLRKWIPEFSWCVDKLVLTDYAVPHARVRVFLRGVRRIVSEVVPACLKPFGERPLRDALGRYPHTPRADYSEPQQENLLAYEALICEKFNEGKLQRSDIVVVAADRAQGMNWNASMMVNKVPTLTTHNHYLVIISVHDVIDNTPDEQREFFRKIHDCERLQLQGLPASLLAWLPAGKAVKASGNAYPVPLIIAVLQPILMAVSSKICLPRWPPPEIVSSVLPDGLAGFERALKAKPRVICKAAHAEHIAKEKALLKKRKRSARSDSE